MTHEELLARCRDHLSRQHCVMWGQHFNILDEDIDAAVEWLAGEITDVVGDLWASGSESKNGDGANGKTPRSPKPRTASAAKRTATGSAAKKKAAASPKPKPQTSKPENDGGRDARGRGTPALP